MRKVFGCFRIFIFAYAFFAYLNQAVAQYYNVGLWSPKYTDDGYFDSSKKLEKLAAIGDADAAFEIGDICLLGRHFYKGKLCTREDNSAAVLWLHKAAALGYANGDGEALVGTKFENAKNDGEAIFWLNRSVAHGSTAGMKELASYKWAHKASASDAEEAVALYRKVADKGDLHAQYSLGLAYLNGDGAPKDIAQADGWFSKVDAGWSAYGMYNAKAGWDEQIGETYLKAGETARALNYLLRAAREQDYYVDANGILSYAYGKQLALQKLGELYRDGIGVARNPEYAQAFLNASQALLNQENAQNAQAQAQLTQLQAQTEQLKNNRMSSIISGALAGLGDSAYASPSPTIQSAANLQMSNIQVAQARTVAAQPVTEKPKAAATSPFKYTPPQPDPGGFVSPGPISNAPPPPPSPSANAPSQGGPILTVYCPANGFVPGVMRTVASDVREGVACTPGSAIYINGIPQFDITCTNTPTWQTGHPPTCPAMNGGTGGGAGSNGGGGINSGQGSGGGSGNGGSGAGGSGTTVLPSGAGSQVPGLNSCVNITNNPDGTATYQNACGVEIRFYWTPQTPAQGQYREQNGYLNSGETWTSPYSGASGFYACPNGYLVEGPDMQVITQYVPSYYCVKP